MEKNGIDLLASLANDQPRKRYSDKLKFNEIPLEHVAVIDRPHTIAIAQAMLQYGDENTKWMIEVLNGKAYNKIIVSYPPGYVFLTKQHLLPILDLDPGKDEYPTVEYIEELWSEPCANKVNLVCKILKKTPIATTTTITPSNITEQKQPPIHEKNDIGVRRQIFNEHNVYVEKQHMNKKRKSEFVLQQENKK